MIFGVAEHVSRIKYKLYKGDKCVSISYTLTHDEDGVRKGSVEDLIISDLKFYKSTGVPGRKVKIYVDNELHKEIQL